MTLPIAAAIYAAAIAAALACLLRWEIRRARSGRSARRAQPASERAQRALARWLAGYGKDRNGKKRRRKAA